MTVRLTHRRHAIMSTGTTAPQVSLDVAHRMLLASAGQDADRFELAERATVLAGALLAELRELAPTRRGRRQSTVSPARRADDQGLPRGGGLIAPSLVPELTFRPWPGDGVTAATLTFNWCRLRLSQSRSRVRDDQTGVSRLQLDDRCRRDRAQCNPCSKDSNHELDWSMRPSAPAAHRSPAGVTVRVSSMPPVGSPARSAIVEARRGRRGCRLSATALPAPPATRRYRVAAP